MLQSSAEIGVYADDNAVTVATPTARVGVRDADDRWQIGGRYLVDVVSAASPDIVATASPRWRAVRHVASVDGGGGGRTLRANGSASASIEPDYRSLNAGFSPTWSIDQDHIKLSAGYSLGHDTVGRRGTPFSVFHRTWLRHAFSLGASFVINRSTLFSLGSDALLEHGDQAKPYRYIPMFSAEAAERVGPGASAAVVDAERLPERPLERLPERRGRFAVTARLAHRMTRATLRLEERVYADTWSQLASTSDVRYLHDLGSRLSVGPSVRLHVQSATSFWQRTYVPSPTESFGLQLPAYRTGDRELGGLWTATVGGDAKLRVSAPQAKQRVSLSLRIAGSHTRFLDTLFVSSRNALLTAVGIDAELD